MTPPGSVEDHNCGDVKHVGVCGVWKKDQTSSSQPEATGSRLRKSCIVGNGMCALKENDEIRFCCIDLDSCSRFFLGGTFWRNMIYTGQRTLFQREIQNYVSSVKWSCCSETEHSVLVCWGTHTAAHSGSGLSIAKTCKWPWQTCAFTHYLLFKCTTCALGFPSASEDLNLSFSWFTLKSFIPLFDVWTD